MTGFVSYAIRSRELAEALKGAETEEFLEACSFLEVGPEGVVVNRQVFELFDYGDSGLHLEKHELALVCGEQGEDAEYTEEKKKEDTRALLDWDVLHSAVEGFITDYDKSNEVFEIIENLPEDAVTCKILMADAEPDSSFYDYYHFFGSSSY